MSDGDQMNAEYFIPRIYRPTSRHLLDLVRRTLGHLMDDIGGVFNC